MAKLMTVLLVVAMLAMTGCDYLLSDISGWDMTACGSWTGMGVCYELFSDNQEQILGGQTAVDAAMGWMGWGDDPAPADGAVAP